MNGRPAFGLVMPDGPLEVLAPEGVESQRQRRDDPAGQGHRDDRDSRKAREKPAENGTRVAEQRRDVELQYKCDSHEIDRVRESCRKQSLLQRMIGENRHDEQQDTVVNERRQQPYTERCT